MKKLEVILIVLLILLLIVIGVLAYLKLINKNAIQKRSSVTPPPVVVTPTGEASGTPSPVVVTQ